jgi:alcohol dehydrogenase YqhD (iron-dependent ADH family)
MENFIYQNPTKIIFGKGTEQELGSQIKLFGSKVLLHYGSGSIKKNGLYQKVIEQLQEHNISFVELGGVIPNPSVDLVKEGIALCKKEHVDFVLAVGGGSVIDSAKAIAIGYYYNGDVWDFFVKGVVPKQALPIGVVLTIPAAGSESSNAIVITNYQSALKRSCRHEIVRPKFAILNPEVTYTLPAYQSAVGAIDMIGHVIERYFTNTPSVDLIDRMSEGLMKTVVKEIKQVMKNPFDYDARAQIMLASTLAHNGSLGIGKEEDWACHFMEYEVTQRTSIAHGHGLAILYPAWMRYVYEHDVKRFANFGQYVFDIPYSDNTKQMAIQAIDALKAFYHELGITTKLREIGVLEEDLLKMAISCTNNGTKILGHFVPLNKSDVLNIYKLAF